MLEVRDLSVTYRQGAHAVPAVRDRWRAGTMRRRVPASRAPGEESGGIAPPRWVVSLMSVNVLESVGSAPRKAARRHQACVSAASSCFCAALRTA